MKRSSTKILWHLRNKLFLEDSTVTFPLCQIIVKRKGPCVFPGRKKRNGHELPQIFTNVMASQTCHSTVCEGMGGPNTSLHVAVFQAVLHPELWATVCPVPKATGQVAPRPPLLGFFYLRIRASYTVTSLLLLRVEPSATEWGSQSSPSV